VSDGGALSSDWKQSGSQMVKLTAAEKNFQREYGYIYRMTSWCIEVMFF